MKQEIQIDCPQEILIGLHMNAENFSKFVKKQTALALFKEGHISSSVAARWLEMPRVHFLLQAMEAGATLLEDSEDDFRREIALI